jgi:Flp pilus assembly protein TadG
MKKMTLFRRGRRRAAQGGGAAVEFVLVFPLFAGLVMGAIDYGYYFYSSQIVTNAAREGARSGSLVDPTPVGAGTTATNTAKTVATTYMTNNGVLCPPAEAATCVSANIVNVTVPSLGVPYPTVDVVIRFTTRSLTGFTGVLLPRHLYARSVMRWQ